MENYEEKYNEALERAKDFMNGEVHYELNKGENIMCWIFPELRESEDERIKKEIINYFKCQSIEEPTRKEIHKKWISWLEKQGEKLPAGFYYVNSEGKKFYSDTFKYGDITLHVEKQGEQKLADKVEPKFKVGDWIVYNINKNIFLIKSVNGEYFTLEDIKGNIYAPCLPPTKNYHHWTIQDAKPGDVLVDVYGNIGIFEERYGINWHTYCYLGNKGRFIAASGSHGSICYPATKEQRDTLEKAMADAGYTFDFDKKKLKKIEQNPAWSNEDESNLNGIIDEIEVNKNNAPDYDLATYDRFLSWLKSLKERGSWKPSEEQMRVLSIYADQNTAMGSVLTSLYNDLKKIKRE